MSIATLTGAIKGLTLWGAAASKSLDSVATSADRAAQGVSRIPELPSDDGALSLDQRRGRGITVTDSVGPTDSAAPPNYLMLSMGSQTIATTVARVEESAARVETIAAELTDAVEQVKPFSYAQALQDSFRDAMPTLGRVMAPNLTAIMQRSYAENTPKFAAEVRKAIEETMPKVAAKGGECGKASPANTTTVQRLIGGLR